MPTAKQVGDYLVTLAHREGDPITHLKLQKLCYYVQGFSLAIRDKPMFPETIQAWDHGPVVPALFQQHKQHGNQVIPRPDRTTIAEVSVKDRELIQEVYKVYGQFSGWRLRDMTHTEPPWKNVFVEGVPFIEITLDAMKAYFKTQLT